MTTSRVGTIDEVAEHTEQIARDGREWAEVCIPPTDEPNVENVEIP